MNASYKLPNHYAKAWHLYSIDAMDNIDKSGGFQGTAIDTPSTGDLSNLAPRFKANFIFSKTIDTFYNAGINSPYPAANIYKFPNYIYFGTKK